MNDFKKPLNKGISLSYKIDLLSKIELRADIRNKIKMLISLGIKTAEDSHVMANYITELEKYHSEILPFEIEDGSIHQSIIGFSLCGFSPEHGYFRNKYGTFSTLEIASKEMKIKSEDPGIRFPLIILKETWYRSKSPAMVDFDKTPIEFKYLAFSYAQEVVDKILINSKLF